MDGFSVPRVRVVTSAYLEIYVFHNQHVPQTKHKYSCSIVAGVRVTDPKRSVYSLKR